jgi:hypothetical protein
VSTRSQGECVQLIPRLAARPEACDEALTLPLTLHADLAATTRALSVESTPAPL